MSVLDWLRKGFGYMLLTMGVSRPAQKPKPAEGSSNQPASKPGGAPPRP